MDSKCVLDVTTRLTDRLWLITSGSPAADCAQMAESEALRVRIAEIRDSFDYVWINTPPAATCADAMNLGPLADGFILVVEANSTRREAALQVKQDLEAAGAWILGAVLSERTFPIPNAIYSRLRMASSEL